MQPKKKHYELWHDRLFLTQSNGIEVCVHAIEGTIRGREGWRIFSTERQARNTLKELEEGRFTLDQFMAGGWIFIDERG